MAAAKLKLLMMCVPVWLLVPGVSSNNNGGHVVEIDQSLMEGPFAKFFAGKGRSSSDQKQSGMSPDKIKDAAKEILRWCREGLSEEEERLVPSLRLNYDDVLTAWSDRGDPWVDFKRAADDSISTVCTPSHSSDTKIPISPHLFEVLLGCQIPFCSLSKE